jgi:hypothetical protein
MKFGFESGVMHYDRPPPDRIDDLASMAADDQLRFGNELRAWIEVNDAGRITGHGYEGGGVMGATTMKLGVAAPRFAAIGLPDIQQKPVVGPDRVRFVQTAGGRAGIPAPRRVRRKPFIQWKAPLVWTTLELTIHADGRTEWNVGGASKFPRHWIYDNEGVLAAKVGLADFKEWYRQAFGKHSPWGDEESPALVTAAESALERMLSTQVMRGGEKPKVKKVKAGTTITREGEPGDGIYLVLDGVVRIEKDGERLAEYGPGALLGERAVLEGGVRTATNVAVTNCRLAFASADQVDRAALAELSKDHRREDTPRK